jgi:hypothetical protein
MLPTQQSLIKRKKSIDLWRMSVLSMIKLNMPKLKKKSSWNKSKKRSSREMSSKLRLNHTEPIKLLFLRRALSEKCLLKVNNWLELTLLPMLPIQRRWLLSPRPCLLELKAFLNFRKDLHLPPQWPKKRKCKRKSPNSQLRIRETLKCLLIKKRTSNCKIPRSRNPKKSVRNKRKSTRKLKNLLLRLKRKSPLLKTQLSKIVANKLKVKKPSKRSRRTSLKPIRSYWSKLIQLKMLLAPKLNKTW